MSIPVIGYSQVTLTSSLAPSPGTMFLYYDANVPNPPFTFNKSGTANTWDFSTLFASPSDEDTVSILFPTNAPAASSFPGATHVQHENGEGSYTFLKINSSGIQFMGAANDITGSGNYMPMVANMPLTAMAFPYTYGNSNSASGYFEVYATGASVGQPLADSVHYKSSINVQRDVIAGGDIIIPAGTFPAILERSIDNSIDTLWIKSSLTGGQWTISPGFPQTNLDSSFYWYTNQSLQPYAHALFDNTGTMHDVTYYKTTTASVISENTYDNIGLYPNPAADILNLDLPSGNGDYSIIIYNVSGEVVYTINTSYSIFNISNLQKGFYIIEVRNNKGFKYSTKFVKN